MSIFLQTDRKNVAFECGFIEIKNNDEHNNKRKIQIDSITYKHQLKICSYFPKN